MALRKIRLLGDEILTKKAKPVKVVTPNLLMLLDDMADTMYHAYGVGLAAPQVGILRRVVVIDVGDGPVELVNPEVIEKHGVQKEMEGCLSCPGVWGITKRPLWVKVRAQDRLGIYHEYEGQDLLARAFCHEIDHLDGIMFRSHIVEYIEPDPED